MKTRVLRFIGIDFIAIPEPVGPDKCEGCALNSTGFDCETAHPTCACDKTIYVINEESLARHVADKLINKET